jgi:hypothetical protein
VTCGDLDGLPASDRDYPWVLLRSGMQRARTIRSGDPCQAFSVVRIGPRAGMIATRLSGFVHCRGKSFAGVAPRLAPITESLSGCLGDMLLPMLARPCGPVVTMRQAVGATRLPRPTLDSSRLPYRSRSACQAANFSGRIRRPSYKSPT